MAVRGDGDRRQKQQLRKPFQFLSWSVWVVCLSIVKPGCICYSPHPNSFQGGVISKSECSYFGQSRHALSSCLESSCTRSQRDSSLTCCPDRLKDNLIPLILRENSAAWLDFATVSLTQVSLINLPVLNMFIVFFFFFFCLKEINTLPQSLSLRANIVKHTCAKLWLWIPSVWEVTLPESEAGCG